MSSNQNNGSSGRTRAEKLQAQSRNLVLLAVTTILSAIVVSGVLAATSAVFGGPPIFQGALGFLGYEIPGVLKGPGRALFLLAILLVLSWGVDLAGVDTSVPFWVGLTLIIVIVAEYIIPDFITSAFAPLQIGQLFLGFPLSQLNVPRVVIIGIAFIFTYYVVLYRVNGALERSPGSKSIGSVLKMTRTQIGRLMDDYATVFFMVAGIFGVIAFGAGVIGGASVLAFVGEIFQLAVQFPAWAGYIVTLLTWGANTLTGILPFHLNPTELAAVFLLILVVVIGLEYQRRQ